MKNKIFILTALMILLIAPFSSVLAKCFVNNKEIPCDIFWKQYGLFLVVPFTLIGLLLVIKPDWAIKFQIWSQKIVDSKWVPGKIIPKIYRFMGIIFLILGLIFIYFMVFNYAKPQEDLSSIVFSFASPKYSVKMEFSNSAVGDQDNYAFAKKVCSSEQEYNSIACWRYDINQDAYFFEGPSTLFRMVIIPTGDKKISNNTFVDYNKQEDGSIIKTTTVLSLSERSINQMNFIGFRSVQSYEQGVGLNKISGVASDYTSCLYKISPDYYLAYLIDSESAGSVDDNCTRLERLGLIKISVN
jgi:hypothetical protein